MINRPAVLFALVSLANLAAPARARDIRSNLLICATITDPSQRLACYDREVAPLKRQPNALQPQEEERRVAEGEHSIRSITEDIEGAFITLDDGSSWRQNDSNGVPAKARPGAKIMLKRGALGSYLILFSKSMSMKVRQIR